MESPRLPKGDASPRSPQPADLAGCLSVLGLQADAVDGAQLVSLSVDATGGLCVDARGLDAVLVALARAVLEQGSRLAEVQAESEKLGGRAHSLEMSSTDVLGKLEDCELAAQLASYQMSQLELSKLGISPPEISRIGQRRLSAVDGPDQVTRMGMATALQELESSILGCLVERDSQTRRQFADVAGRLEVVETNLEADEKGEMGDLDDMNVRFVMAHDEVVGVRADLGNLQRTLKESLLLKADEKDVADLRRASDKLQAETRQAQAVLLQANISMGKYDDILRELDWCRAQVQELLKLFQSECQDIRDWTTASLADLRNSTREKINQVEEAGLVDDLRRELRDGVARCVVASERCQADVRHKASSAEVTRLREEVATISRSIGQERQLLIGTRCLGCDRPLGGPARATDHGHVDVAKMKDQDSLVSTMEQLLAECPEEMKLVATRLGSPGSGRRPAAGGPGGLAGAARAPSSARATTADSSSSRRAWGGLPAARRGGADMPERFPAREVPPLVRVPPRSPAGRGGGSLRQALGNAAT